MTTTVPCVMLFSSLYYHYFSFDLLLQSGEGRGHGRMVVGFTTTYEISAYHHWCCEFESWSGREAQHYVIKFVSDLRQVGGFPHDISHVLVLDVFASFHDFSLGLWSCSYSVSVCGFFFLFFLCIFCFCFFFYLNNMCII